MSDRPADHLPAMPERSSRDGAEWVFDVRRGLYERFPVPPAAFSIDGVDATVVAPLDLGISVGDLVVVELDDGAAWVGQIRGLDLVEREAAQVELVDDDLGSMTVRPLLRSLRGDAALLGRLDDGCFTPALAPVFGESRLRRATSAEVAAVLAPPDQSGLVLGPVSGEQGVSAPLRPEGFARHTFLCGQSGSGKTYTTGVLLEELLLRTELPMIVLDPNSDYVHLGQPAAGDTEPGRSYAARATDIFVARARGSEGDGLLLAAHASDLPVEVLAGLARLDPIDDLQEFAALRRLATSLRPPYSLADLLVSAEDSGSDHAMRLADRLRNLGVAEWGVWCRPGEPSLPGSGVLAHRGVVVDLGSLSSTEESALAALVALQILWDRRRRRVPVLVVVDEAHNLFPTHPTDTVGRALLDLGVRIAGEGRKFGLHLLLCTQRPAKLHPSVVSQCDNLVMLRMNSAGDVDELARTFSHVPEGMVRRAPALRQGEVLVAGPIAPIPRFLRTRARLSVEGGSDVPTDWAR
ncbi:MAG TPA: ATP-binding protein [Acidimicrobiales bacterium]|nr:ATP-binding protein [Acidimicrobiales bacterium]